LEIEKEIYQSQPFKSHYQKLMVNLMFSYNWISDRQKQFFKNYNLTPKQYNILRILRGAGTPISTLTIRERMLDKMSDASRIVDRLEKKGLVKKSISKKDNRKLDVTLTRSSKNLLTKIDINIDELEKEFNSLTTNEAQQLSQLLDKMRA
jgi:DNA-binding MarR family transcriptional regulator